MGLGSFCGLPPRSHGEQRTASTGTGGSGTRREFRGYQGGGARSLCDFCYVARKLHGLRWQESRVVMGGCILLCLLGTPGWSQSAPGGGPSEERVDSERIGSPRVVSARVGSRRGGSSRELTRVIQGRSEPIRLQFIRQLSLDSRRQLDLAEELVEASTPFIEQAAKIDPLPISVAELLRLLGRIEHPATAGFLIDLLDHSRLDLAMLAADALGEFRRDAAIAPLRQQIEHPQYPEHYGFRFNLVRALLRMRHPDAVEFLGTLEKRLSGQLQYELTRHLDEVTHEHFGGDQERYETWRRQTGRARDTSAIKLATKSGSQGSIQLARSSYYGIPIHAQRLVFVIDCSGSMKTPTYGGTRLSHAKRELAAAIQSLPDDAEFTVIAFNELILPWRADLVPASPENKTKAIRYVAGLSTSKSTNTYTALREAFEIDTNLEALFLLSDGRPNRGPITAPAAIVQDIAHRNRYRNLVINTIGIAVSGPTQEFMAGLAESNAGMFRAVD